MPKPSSGIYKITNLKNGKIYVGQSQNIYRRREQHFVALRHGSHENHEMQKDYAADWRYFRWDPIEFCPLSKLNEREHFWIQELHSMAPHGYNLDWVPYARKTKAELQKRRRVKHYHKTR